MKYICPYCNKELTSGRSLGGHKTKCMLNPNKTTNKGKHIKHRKRIYEDILVNCKYCGKQWKNLNSLRQHEIRCKQNPDHIIQKPTYGYKGRVGWSKGLTKEVDVRLKHLSDSVNKYFETHKGAFNGKHHTPEVRSMMSTHARESNFQSHWGTRKSYEYKGKKFISSYEVDVAKSLDENCVRWEKPDYGKFNYTDPANKKHTYTPDFYLPDYDVYLDPKNDFLIENINPVLGYNDCDKIKWVSEQNNVKIIVLNKNQLLWSVIKNMI